MKRNTKKRKNASKYLGDRHENNPIADRVIQLIGQSKIHLDHTIQDLGKMLVEAIMYIEREEISGPDYHPHDSAIKKWASQPGSVYIGNNKVKVEHPRLRDTNRGKEIPLRSYQRLKAREQFSEELLFKCLAGLSERKYDSTINDCADGFGISPSSVSRHIVEATAGKLKKFCERSLNDFVPFSIKHQIKGMYKTGFLFTAS